jgi:type II restriction enzyme
MKQPFEELIANLRSVIASFAFYTDFEKVVSNVKRQQARLDSLEYIMRSNHFDEELVRLINNDPKMIGLLANLLAIRKNFDVLEDNRIRSYDLSSKTLSDQDYIDFVNESGLVAMFRDGLITDLKSYLLGVEVGLDSNARKNRGGTAMEKLVEDYIIQLDLPYYSQVSKSTIKNKFGIDIDAVLNDETLQSASKVFDFVVVGQEKIYLIETSFYSGGGSVLSRTSRSFRQLDTELMKLESVEFIWITDGKGWKTAKGNLKETYDSIRHLYTIMDLENGILNKVIL